ncbi:site-specific tyrosine recombinase/integron integrase [Paenibacillus macquariensis]|uniref:Integrase/recombinase XerD n=1 Tax=Paenibacillus macquariensis TaxID=948756 RepID=A0ABY1K6Z8_9BACL|nr:site-specific tyrosine recombinase/integron integrase [Paenibacillus macquariensis]MEC0092514.1 tyrosine-type recombinase/integrase [Paenibacillus macquariensis]OAB35471.1 integrase [Paenibacillus macquariensis subsp. macquariensis]SIR35193.1 integrase/recombinase XerD [Paenibacillus macquariensis]
MQAAGEHLLSQVTQSLLGICTGIDLEGIRSKLSEIISGYDIKRIETDQTHPDLQEKIDLYLSGKKLEGLSKVTLGGYKIHLRIFAEHMKKMVEDVTTADIRVYLGRYNNQKITTISTKLSVLKSFFGWLTAEDIIPRDPTARIKPPKKEKRLPKALSIEELEMLREACVNVRQRVLIEVLYATGCRLSEVHAINRSDIDYNTQSCRVIGKGNKEREVYFSFKALFHLKKYLFTRADSEPALIITERKPYRRLSQRGIQREIKIIAENAGLQKKVSPHTMRHTFATLTLNNGADLVAVQELLGHENPATTQIYASITAERKREQHKKHLVQ